MNSRLVPLLNPPAWQRLAGGIQRLAFWAAVVLPLAYVPLLSSPDNSELFLLGALMVAHVCCLLIGHEYSP